MRKQILILIIIILFLSPLSAQAGKPGPMPYPRPGEVVTQGDAYPEPQQGLPGPELPEAPDDFCEDIYDFICAYGWFGRWYVLVQFLGFQPDMEIIICVGQYGSDWTGCRLMKWIQYNHLTGQNVYVADPIHGECARRFPYDGMFYIIYVYNEYTGYADVRQPNQYEIQCRYLALQLRLPGPGVTGMEATR